MEEGQKSASELTELPKAEKHFKQYVGHQINHLIDESEELANRYVKER